MRTQQMISPICSRKWLVSHTAQNKHLNLELEGNLHFSWTDVPCCGQTGSNERPHFFFVVEVFAAQPCNAFPRQ